MEVTLPVMRVITPIGVNFGGAWEEAVRTPRSCGPKSPTGPALKEP